MTAFKQIIIEKQRDEIATLRARVAELEALLGEALDELECMNDGCGCCSSTTGRETAALKHGRAALNPKP